MNLGVSLRISTCGWVTIALCVFLLLYLRSDLSSPSAAAANDDPSSEGRELVNLKSLLKGGIWAAERGGEMVRTARDNPLEVQSKGKTKEGANDPVTNADFASNCAMYYGLKRTFPGVTVISEEAEDPDCGEQEPLDVETTPQDHRVIEYMNDEMVFADDVTVWIDPLDATQEYTENLDQYVTTMVCVAIKGVPVVGVIHYPFTSTTVWGWLSKRTSTNVPKIPYNEVNHLSPRVIVSRSHQGDVKDFVTKAFGDKALVTAAGGAGFKVMNVANGKADVYLHTTAIKKWDICAGNAIINTINGRMTTLSGKVIDYSTKSGVKNSDGLLVTLHNHEYYLNRTVALLPLGHL